MHRVVEPCHGWANRAADGERTTGSINRMPQTMQLVEPWQGHRPNYMPCQRLGSMKHMLQAVEELARHVVG